MTKKNTAKAETTRSTHKWTREQMEFLVARPTMGRTELEAEFRAAFPKFDGSQQSIIGKRYTLLNRPSATKANPALAQQALETRIAQLEHELAQARADLEATHTGEYWGEASDVPSIEEITSMPMDEVRSLADRLGIKKSGGKQAIAERIHAR